MALRKRHLSTDKIKDNQSGLTYNYEDRLSKMKVMKTSCFMLLLSATVFYFLYNLYLLVCNFLFDFYWYNYRGVQDPSNSYFLFSIWFRNFMDMFVLILKMIGSFYIFKYINSKILLTYEDTQELEKYN